LVKLSQLTIKSFAVLDRAEEFSGLMNASRVFQFYAERAKGTVCPTCRAVNMLGMMCAAAVENGGLLAFVGQGYGGDWPDPRETAGEPRRDRMPPGARKG
jgi:hypothetical protein